MFEREDLQELYKTSLTNPEIVTCLDISSEILIQAAQIRATQNIKLPDAIHISTALLCDCGIFITNDIKLKTYSGTNIKIILISELLESLN